MSKHYIYEIFGRKIGATTNVKRRMKQQGAKEGEYRIIEEHTNAKVCSIREIELQKEFNYPVDRIQYWKAIKIHTSLKSKKNRLAKIDWKASRAKIDYSNYTMNQCHTIEANAKRSKPVNQYDLEGNFIKRWDSQTEATRTLKIKSYADISACCKGKQKTAHKFIWKYAG